MLFHATSKILFEAKNKQLKCEVTVKQVHQANFYQSIRSCLCLLIPGSIQMISWLPKHNNTIKLLCLQSRKQTSEALSQQVLTSDEINTWQVISSFFYEFGLGHYIIYYYLNAHPGIPAQTGAKH